MRDMVVRWLKISLVSWFLGAVDRGSIRSVVKERDMNDCAVDVENLQRCS